MTMMTVTTMTRWAADLRCATCGSLLLGPVYFSAWGKRFCTRHELWDRCTGCRLPLGDPASGRSLCADCRPTAVLVQDDVRRVLPLIRNQLGALGVTLRSRTKVRLVDRTQLATTHPGEAGQVTGMTLMRGSAAIEIRVLFGLTHARFGCAVAHELMHAYLFERRYPRVDPRSEEGICELLALAWVRRRAGPLYEAEARRLEQNPDPVYGEGLRLARDAVERLGIAPVLRELRRTGRLPIARPAP